MKNRNHQKQNNNSQIVYNNEYEKSKKKSISKKPEKQLLYKLIHPDYILFDWEYFSHELEFE